MVEHFHGKEGVAGSSPAPGSFILVADRTPNRTGRGRTRQLALLATAALLAALAIPTAAFAVRPFTTGFSGGDQYQSSDSSQGNVWLNRTVDAGAGIVRLAVEWPGLVTPVKPADPTNPGSVSYDFSTLDQAVTDVESHGLKVLLSINHAPTWAEGPNRPSSAATGTWEPNPSDLADFAQALASRYSGNFMGLPAVQAIEVWDEPNSGDWLTPQFEGKTFTGAAIYRDMLNASYKSIKSVNPQVQVVVGGTDPYGDPPGGPYPASGSPRPPGAVLATGPLRQARQDQEEEEGQEAGPNQVRADVRVQRPRQLRRLRPPPHQQHRRRPPPVRPQPVRRLHPRPGPRRQRPARR